MKITIVLGAFFPVPPILGGAVEKVWFSLGQEFVRQGHQVVQISRAHPTLPKREDIAGVQHRRVPGYNQPRSIIRLKWRDLLYSLRVRRILPAADILVTNTFWLPLLVRQKKRGLLHVHIARGPKGQMRWYSHAARLLAVSRAIADEVIAQEPDLRPKVRVIPNPVPFQTSPAAYEKRDTTVLFVGRIHPEKGIELLLHALAHLPPDVLGCWKFEFVGPHLTALGGGGENFLREMQHLGKLSGAKIEWSGPIFDPKELAARYQKALLFIYPSVAETGEALPLAPLEAMAHGCPPLVSSLACFRDYIEDEVTGFVFDHRAPEPETKLAARLTNLLSCGETEIGVVAERARAKAAEFSVENVAQRYLQDFTELLANKPA